MVAHPRSENGGFCFVLKFRLDRIYGFGDCDFNILAFWLETVYSPPLLGGLGICLLQMTLSIVVTPKRQKHVV